VGLLLRRRCRNRGGDLRGLNPTAGAAWSPVVITVPVNTMGPTNLTINLTNNLTFAGGAVPTSLTIVGQLGGGLGISRTTTASPTHGPQGVTWSTQNTGNTNTPPIQGPRVQSLATEVAAGSMGTLTWNNLRPGTYLIESGTHPSIQGPMGLYGMLVVTAAPTSAIRPAAPYSPKRGWVPRTLQPQLPTVTSRSLR